MNMIERAAKARADFRQYHGTRCAQTVAVKSDDLDQLCNEVLEHARYGDIDGKFEEAVIRGGDTLVKYINDHEMSIYGMKIVVVDTVIT